MTKLTDENEHIVVVAEDEEIIRAVVCEALADAGFNVVETQHADEAVSVLQHRAEEIDALFTDIHMPGSMDGVALAHLSKRSWPWIALLIASGLARPRSEDLPEGSRFLPKPYHPDHVVRHLREMLTGRQKPTGNKQEQTMGDRAEGTIADTGEAIQQRVNQADEAVEQLTKAIRQRPIIAVMIAVGVGYLLGKVV
jgi:CheY-like chemotaxis protein